MTMPLFYKRDKFGTIKLLLPLAAYLSTGSISATSAQVQEHRPRFPVTAAQIIGAMQARQLPTQGAEIKIAARITASIEYPQLDIQSVALVSPREIRLRMSCRNHAQCLSFFAVASYPHMVSAEMLPTKLELPPETLKPASSDQTAPVPTVDVITKSTPQAKDSATPGGPTLRIGSPAMLQMDGDRVHILIEVICLENGSAGDKIRVTTRDHKQSYVAQIVSPTLLKGSL